MLVVVEVGLLAEQLVQAVAEAVVTEVVVVLGLLELLILAVAVAVEILAVLVVAEVQA
jgi:hypothetical protein